MQEGPDSVMLIEHLVSPGCPHAAASRSLLNACLVASGITEPVVERVGALPSPSVLVNGIDVMRPDTPPTGECCRLDVPTRTALMAAIARALNTEADGANRPA